MSTITIMTWNLMNLTQDKINVPGVAEAIAMIIGTAYNPTRLTTEPADIVFLLELDASRAKPIMTSICAAANAFLGSNPYDWFESGDAGSGFAYGLLVRHGIDLLKAPLKANGENVHEPSDKKNSVYSQWALPIVKRGYTRKPCLFVFNLGSTQAPHLLPILVCHLKANRGEEETDQTTRDANPLALLEVTKLKDFKIAKLFNAPPAVQAASKKKPDPRILELIITGDFNFDFNMSMADINFYTETRGKTVVPCLSFLTPTRTGDGSTSPTALPGENPPDGRLALRAANTTSGTFLVSPVQAGIRWTNYYPGNLSLLRAGNLDNFFYGGTLLSRISPPLHDIDTCFIHDVPEQFQFPNNGPVQTDYLDGHAILRVALADDVSAYQRLVDAVTERQRSVDDSTPNIETIRRSIPPLTDELKKRKEALTSADTRWTKTGPYEAFVTAGQKLQKAQSEVKKFDEAKRILENFTRIRDRYKPRFLPKFLVTNPGQLTTEVTSQHYIMAARVISDHLPVILRFDPEA